MSEIIIGSYKGTIYPEGNGYTGALDDNRTTGTKRRRIKRKGRTKTIVRERLKAAVKAIESGTEGAGTYLVEDSVRDWLARGLKATGKGTVEKYRQVAEKHLIPIIGARDLNELSADDVDDWLDGLTDKLATRSLQEVHSYLKRAIRQAQVREKVGRNVAELVTTPRGRAGRPSNALTWEQATAVMEAAKVSRLHAYVVVSLTTGVRTEEARALRWDHVVAWTEGEGWRPVSEVGFDHERFAAYVWRSVRVDADTKTQKSRRTIELPRYAVEALRVHHVRQAQDKLKAGDAWQDHGLIFCTQIGTPLDAANVRRSFKSITRRASLGEGWTPRELRHSFVSILSERDVPIERIADLVGHAGTSVTERIYRRQLKPVIRDGAEAINAAFERQNGAKTG